MFAPGLHWGRFAAPDPPSTVTAPAALVPPVGPAGVATLVLQLEPGARLTYGWATEVCQSYSGIEQRISWQAQPHLRIEGRAFSIDADDRAIRAALMANATAGATFLLALPTEELICTAAASGATISVGDTTIADWALPGQRAVILATSGATLAVVVQSATASTLTLDVAPGALGGAGARILPLVPVLLDAQQGFTRYPSTVHLWDVRARSTAYGWAGVDAMGGGTTVLTLDGSVASTALTDDSLIIWDQANMVDGTANESLLSRVDTLDLGGAVAQASGGGIADWIRPIKLRSPDRGDLQWLKAVVHHLRGRQGVFLLPTGRPDFLPYSIPAFGQLLIQGDYASWFSSIAHRRLVLTGAVVTQYVSVTDVVDNGDGTNTLLLSEPALSPVTRISLLETVRLESDDVAPVWDGGVMTIDLVARVVQDDTNTEDNVTTIFAGNGLDGDVSFPVGITDLARDMHYETGQGANGAILRCNGFVPRFRTALIGPPSGLFVIMDDGNAAAGSTAGAGYLDSSEVGTAVTTGGGGNGPGSVGTQRPGGVWPAVSKPGRGGAGGSGSGGSGGAAVDATATTASASAGSLDDAFAALRMRLSSSSSVVTGGGGGGSGAGSGSAPGGGGGGGGRNLAVAAGRVERAANILIRSQGGAGGAGAATNCGGGGGGGGGDVAVAVGRLPFPQMVSAGGAGGASGGGTGAAGAAGAAGTVMQFLG